jgi:hypothetical protein
MTFDESAHALFYNFIERRDPLQSVRKCCDLKTCPSPREAIVNLETAKVELSGGRTNKLKTAVAGGIGSTVFFG